MAIQAKSYANKQGKADGVNNRVQITMSVEEASMLANKEKEAVTELFTKLKAIPEVK